jgi:sulfur carrier protein
MSLTVNGQRHPLPQPPTVPALLDGLGLALGSVVVEHNGMALLRSEAAQQVLVDGDVVELVRAVAGG